MRHCVPDELFRIKTLMRLFALFNAVAIAGCAGSTEESAKKPRPIASDPGSVVQSYLKAPDSERYKYVQNGDSPKDQMAAYYAQWNFPAVESVKIDNIAELKPGAAVVTVTTKQGEITTIGACYVKQTGDHWLVDWPASNGYNPMPLKTFKSTAAPRQTATFRVVAQIADYYNYQYMDARPAYYSIQLDDQMGERVAGYVEKSSKIGQELYDLLRDANGHPITLTVQWNGPLGENVDIVGLVSKTWFVD